jgi:predicted RNA methylase
MGGAEEIIGDRTMFYNGETDIGWLIYKPDAFREILKPYVCDGIFCDVGSGLGDKLLIAHELGFPHVVGIEADKPNAVESDSELAKYMDRSVYDVIHTNAETWDFAPYDVLYCWLNLGAYRNLGIMRQLAQTMRSDAILIAPDQCDMQKVNGKLNVLRWYDSVYVRWFKESPVWKEVAA